MGVYVAMTGLTSHLAGVVVSSDKVLPLDVAPPLGVTSEHSEWNSDLVRSGPVVDRIH